MVTSSTFQARPSSRGKWRGPCAAAAAASSDAKTTTPMPWFCLGPSSHWPLTNPGCCLAQLTMSSRRWRVTTWAREGSIDICTTIVCMAPPDSTVFLLACHARGARTAGPSQFLGILGAGSPSVRTLRLEVLAALRRVIGFDAYVWLVTDPETSVGSAPLADVPCLPELPRLIGLKYLTAVNRWTSMIAPVASLRQATGGDLARSLVWRDLLCRYQITDIASSVYRDRFGCWAFLDLWRMQGAPPFAAAELEFLHIIAGPLATALRHSQAAAFAAARAGQQASAGPVVLLLSPALDVRTQTPETQRYLRLLVPPDDAGQAPVPAGAYNVGAQLLAREAGVDSKLPLARVHLGNGHWLTLRATRMDSAGPVPERDIAVRSESSARGALISLFARSWALSSREA